VAANAPFTLTATVTATGSSPLTGTVTLNVPGGILAGGLPLTNGQAQLQALGYFTNPGVFSITATYSGDTKNAGSVSSAVAQVITGTVPITVVGSTGNDTHVLNGTIGLQ
jgi:hypothetical protein